MLIFGFFELFSSTGSSNAAVGAFVAAGLLGSITVYASYRKSRYMADLGALEARHAVDNQLIDHGYELSPEAISIYRHRAGEIGYLRGLLGYVPKAGTLQAIDYQHGIRAGRL
jgi:hypothetical protein